ncbi:MAG: hypothetical protein ACJAYC_001518 [Halieaceae bacterium]|jgi:uncharacterized protein (DUF885 family)
MKNNMTPVVSLLLIVAMALGSLSCSNAEPPPAQPLETQGLEQFLNTVFERRVAADPVLASRLGSNASSGEWFDLSLGAWDLEAEQAKQDLQTLRAEIDFQTLDRPSQVDYRAFEAELELRLKRYRWRYHLNPINQIVGPHLTIAGTLLNSHPIDSRQSAELYVERLRKVPVPLQQLAEHLQARRAMGIRIPPAVAERLIDGARSIIEGDENVILANFEKKLTGLNLDDGESEALLAEARTAYAENFVPAYTMLIEELKSGIADATDTGVWALPDGAEFYEFLIDQYTTAEFSPKQIHQLGLSEVERIQGEMDKIRQRVAFPGDLKAFFAHLKTDPAFYFPNTDEGRQAYLELAQHLAGQAHGTMDQILPYPMPHPLQIRRIEAFREKSAPVGFYESGSPDNDNVGTVYLGMYDMSSLSTFDLPALLFHEGVPGHHLQSSVMLSRDIPEIRQYYIWWSNTAFTEGWALYAEYLADELGLYEDDYAQFGQLAGELWRACRLVVDSGLHLKEWSRAEAIEYLNSNTASSEENNERAVDRYMAVPGQATAFKIGMQVMIDLRAGAEQRLGSEFDLAAFHALILENGPLPLSLLREEVEAWKIADEAVSQP